MMHKVILLLRRFGGLFHHRKKAKFLECSVDHFPHFLRRLGYLNPLILMSDSLVDNPHYAYEKALKRAGLLSSKYLISKDDDIVEKAILAKQIFNKNNCDCIVSIGNSEVIDTGKITSALIANRNESIYQLYGFYRVHKKPVYHLAIPSKVLGGAESSDLALTNGKKHHYIFSKRLKPDLVLIDRNALVYDSELKAAALASIYLALDSYILPYGGYKKDKEAKQALRLLAYNFHSYVYDKEEKESIHRFQKGGYLLGLATSRSLYSVGSAIAFKMASKYQTSFVSVYSYIFLSYLKEAIKDKVIRKRLLSLYDLLGGRGASSEEEKLDIIYGFCHKFYEDMELEEPQIDLSEEAIKEVAKEVFLLEKDRLFSYPYLMKEERIIAILKGSKNGNQN